MLATLLSGCTAVRFTYSQGPLLSYWWLDGYADFDAVQAPKVRGTLDTWFRWHAQTQLDDYAQFLVRVQSHASDPIAPEQVCRLYQDAMTRLDPMLEKALPMAVETVRSLSLAQIEHIEEKYAKVNRDFRKDFLQADPKSRFDASFKRALDRAEMVYGSLDDAQLDLLRQGIAASPFDPELWLNERMQRQREVLATLRRLVNERAGADQTLAALRVVVYHAVRSPRPAYVDYQRRLHQYNCRLAAQLHSSASREQRAAAFKLFKSWEEDARSLASEARRTAP